MKLTHSRGELNKNLYNCLSITDLVIPYTGSKHSQCFRYWFYGVLYLSHTRKSGFMKPELFFGGLLGLIPITIGIVEKRSSYQKKLNALSLFQKKIDFLNTWLKAQESASSPEIEVKKAETIIELNKIAEEYRELFEEDEKASVLPDRPFMRRTFLTYVPINIFGKFWQVLYYMSLGILGLMCLGLAIDENTGDFSFPAFLSSLQDGEILAGVVSTVLMLLVFHYLTRVSEKIFLLKRISNMKK